MNDWWETDEPGTCWVCKQPTRWVYLDLGHQHTDCDAYPNEDGTHTVVIGGEVQ